VKAVNVKFLLPDYIEDYDIADLLNSSLHSWQFLNTNNDCHRCELINDVDNSLIILIEKKEIQDAIKE
jgi:hypothetical protein